jgi:methyl-accepting chemotaxis protein
MTVTELMLDIASGDASEHDVHIQECLGHINISAREFAAAYSISDYPGDLPSIIVEAAANAKLPTDKGEAKEVANTAVIQGLSAFYNLMIATAKKVRAATERELRAYAALGKKYGINFDKHNFLTGFLNPLCAAVEKDGLLGKLDDRSFIKGKYAARMVENYGKGMANLMSGYGLSIDNVFGDSVVGLIIRNNFSGKKTIKDLRDVESNMSTGGKQLNFDKTLDKKTHYQDYVKIVDFKMLAISIYALSKISESIIVTLGNASTKKTAMDNIKKLFNEASDGNKRVVRSVESISDGTKEWSDNLNKLTANMAGAFTDSSYELLKMLKKSTKSK